MPNAYPTVRTRWPDPGLSPLPHPSWDRPSEPTERNSRLSASEFWNRLGL